MLLPLAVIVPIHDFTITVGAHTFGLVEDPGGSTRVLLGRFHLAHFTLPFSATMCGLLLTCAAAAMAVGILEIVRTRQTGPRAQRRATIPPCRADAPRILASQRDARN